MPLSTISALRARAVHDKKETEPALFYQGYGNSGGDPALVTRALLGCKGAWSYYCDQELEDMVTKAVGIEDAKTQHAAFEKLTDHVKAKAIITLFYQVHDVYAFDKKWNFVPRYDETIFAWEISAK